MKTKTLFRTKVRRGITKTARKIGSGFKGASRFLGYSLLLGGLMLTPSWVIGKKLQEKKKKQNYSHSIGAYPNFSNAGTLGNPALWQLTGNWVFVLSGINGDKTPSVLVMGNRMIYRLCITGVLDSSFDTRMPTEKLTLGMGFPLFTLKNNALFLGAQETTTLKTDRAIGHTDVSFDGKVGLLHSLDIRNFGIFIRSGTTYSIGDNSLRLETEARMAWKMLEFTLSTNATLDFDSADPLYNSHWVGGQIRMQQLIGPNISSVLDLTLSWGIDAVDGDNTHTHLRFAIPAWAVLVDLHLDMDGAVFKQASIGVTFY